MGNRWTMGLMGLALVGLLAGPAFAGAAWKWTSEDGSVSFRVDARGGREAVRQVIALGRTLAEEGQPDLTEGLNYRLLP